MFKSNYLLTYLFKLFNLIKINKIKWIKMREKFQNLKIQSKIYKMNFTKFGKSDFIKYFDFSCNIVSALLCG